MANPRIFVSSTYYDLRYVRSDLDILADHIGLEIVKFEEGLIPYHTSDTLPQACCKEIENCNILLLIIGGRYGSRVVVETKPDEKTGAAPEKREISISRLEVEHAIECGLLLFTFVEAGVRAEHRTYKANLHSKGRVEQISWASVDDIAVFEFIDYVENLGGKNPIFEFRTPREIQDLMRRQLSGLFFELLQSGKMERFGTHLQQVVDSAERFSSLQTSLQEKELELRSKLDRIILPEHEFFHTIKEVLKANFTVYFSTFEDFCLLLSHFGFTEERDVIEIPEWHRDMITLFNPETNEYFGISRRLFGSNGELDLSCDWRPELLWRGLNIPQA